MFLGVESYAKSISRVVSSRTRCNISPCDSYRESIKFTRISSPILRFSNFDILESSRVRLSLIFKLSSIEFSSTKFSHVQAWNFLTFKFKSSQITKYPTMQIFKSPSIQTLEYLSFSNFQIVRFSNSRTLKICNHCVVKSSKLLTLEFLNSQISWLSRSKNSKLFNV